MAKTATMLALHSSALPQQVNKSRMFVDDSLQQLPSLLFLAMLAHATMHTKGVRHAVCKVKLVNMLAAHDNTDHLSKVMRLSK